MWEVGKRRGTHGKLTNICWFIWCTEPDFPHWNFKCHIDNVIMWCFSCFTYQHSSPSWYCMVFRRNILHTLRFWKWRGIKLWWLVSNNKWVLLSKDVTSFMDSIWVHLTPWALTTQTENRNLFMSACSCAVLDCVPFDEKMWAHTLFAATPPFVNFKCLEQMNRDHWSLLD